MPTSPVASGVGAPPHLQIPSRRGYVLSSDDQLAQNDREWTATRGRQDERLMPTSPVASGVGAPPHLQIPSRRGYVLSSDDQLAQNDVAAWFGAPVRVNDRLKAQVGTG